MYNNMGLEEIILAQREELGIKKGEKAGTKKTKSTIARSLLEQTDFSVAKIAQIVGVQETFVQRLKKCAECA